MPSLFVSKTIAMVVLVIGLLGCQTPPNREGDSQQAHHSKASDDPCAHIDTKKEAQKKSQCIGDQIAMLEKEIEYKQDLFANHKNRPLRTKFISSITTEPAFVNYKRAVLHQVEILGNLQYPQEAKLKGIYGNVILSVKIGSDGSLINTQIMKSSGYLVLDKAATETIIAAAPFVSFSEAMGKKVEAVVIISTFQYVPRNR